MSKRRKDWEIVRRHANSGFLIGDDPSLVKLHPEEELYITYCMLDCGDPNCREWANCEVVEGSWKGDFLYHISECQMSDVNEQIPTND